MGNQPSSAFSSGIRWGWKVPFKKMLRSYSDDLYTFIWLTDWSSLIAYKVQSRINYNCLTFPSFRHPAPIDKKYTPTTHLAALPPGALRPPRLEKINPQLAYSKIPNDIQRKAKTSSASTPRSESWWMLCYWNIFLMEGKFFHFLLLFL